MPVEISFQKSRTGPVFLHVDIVKRSTNDFDAEKKMNKYEKNMSEADLENVKHAEKQQEYFTN